jgi:FecR protein
MPKDSLRALAAVSFFLVLGLARAQDTESYDDPPDRAARLSYLQGDVSMQPAGEEEWAPALLNRPLTTGDKLWSERGARAEIQVGPADVRLGDETGFSFLNVDDDTIQMRMTAGVVYVNVRELQGNDHIEIDTPNVALTVLRAGSYRFEVNDAGDTTTVKISEGEAEADGPGQNVIVHAQQVVTFRGADQLVADWGSLGSPDEFDRWNLERDRRDERVASSRTAEYVSPDVTGYEDLDDNGTWSPEPEYGYVWTPTRVVAGWSPYRYGRWVWIAPWGYTWIDDAPWGYAPFHYGRWAHVRNRWCWVPGPRHVRPVYAPALVGWVGAPGLNVSVSFGRGVGWFPLGPREVYVPGRRFSHRYVERVNVTNTVIVNRTYLNEVYANGGRNVAYRNRNVPGAFTVVSRDTFIRAGRTGDRHARLDEREFSRGAVSGAPQLQPGRESRFGGPTRVDVRVPPRNVVDRQVIVKRDPPSTSARFARGRGAEDVARAPSERFQRPANAPQREWRTGGDGNVAGDRRGDREGHGARAERPVRLSPQPGSPAVPQTPTVQQPSPEQRAFRDRTRDDRPPKQRDGRGDDRAFERLRERQANQPQSGSQPGAQRDDQQRQQQADAQQRWQRDQQQRDQQQRDQQQREWAQRAQQQQQQQREQQSRERFQRQQDSERPATRPYESRPVEVRQRPQERPRDVPRPQPAQPRSEPKPVSRAEPSQNSTPRAGPRNQDNPRSNRK